MQIILANPRGFCAGVDRAITIVERALELFGAPVYVRHEVVHNRYVVNRLKELGAIFIEDLNDVPDDSILIFSAHGVSKTVRDEAKRRQLRIFDATCPLVTKVHMEVARASYRGEEVILIGHAGHIEVDGTMGQYGNPAGGIYLVESIKDVQNLQVKNDNHLCFTTQTTLSVDDTAEIIEALKNRFPNIRSPRKNDICYATTNRQQAVKQLSSQADIVLVVGSKNSSNSSRLAELARRNSKNAYLIDYASDINLKWLENAQTIGVTAGASAPEILVKQVIEHLKSLGCTSMIETEGISENITFEIPKELRIEVKTTD
ncbi:4-hydroxy-3-methylbut-2-enyl diphosphate reductase [Gilliamella sp. B3023]|uniref:4-hydroxy-3-methylbut-2-enyl diphosphate reductase n=1 Tax=unclassified Gilliamella TaxID=2685620 RepID=UPI00226A6B64|nr:MULTISPECIES: 4-hydroxy-3-methylbut-2-enyl diphosphate reductase [unclassified Gilliamella]MCX8586776.1 4-hydroxy-3-methylbut-2-enyl diphosphate reductase [Gilliamella sp. B3562]MCX8675715.1 4-hydroxy-3-methylbut-2-enyl diphosphate reductase [Gilliamella sp. B3023]MCX8686434.1 4-hydroxy-3-methylbut-2-enyl diphosphate reductase [Gilliamella sp. B2864]